MSRLAARRVMSRPTDYTDPATVDIDEVIANIKHAYQQRGDHWTFDPVWPNVTVLALALEVESLVRRFDAALRELTDRKAEDRKASASSVLSGGPEAREGNW